MLRDVFSAAFAAHVISAVFVALIIPRACSSAAFAAFPAFENKGLRLRGFLERRSFVACLFTIGLDRSRDHFLSVDWRKVRSSGLLIES